MLNLNLDLDMLIICAAIFFALVALLYIFWDVHYFLRVAFAIGYSKFFETPVKPDKTTTIYGFCSTNDLDIMFLHMNNARYIRELDFARFHFYYQTGIYRAITAASGNVLQSASHIRYRRTIPLFSLFKVTTKLVYWDDKELYLEQQFITLRDGFVRAISLSKQTVVGPNVRELLAKLLEKDATYKPTPPAELEHWRNCIEVSSAKLRKKD